MSEKQAPQMTETEKAIRKVTLDNRKNNTLRERADLELSLKFSKMLIDKGIATEADKTQREEMLSNLKRIEIMEQVIEEQYQELENAKKEID